MSIDLSEHRRLIAAVLAPVVFTVDGSRYGLTAHTSTPPTISTWDAWPVVSDIRDVTDCIGEVDWFVFVALPAGDQASLVEAGDAVVDPTREALRALGAVTHTRPFTWTVADGAAVPVWQFEITI
jgi:hypothetical protein